MSTKKKVILYVIVTVIALVYLFLETPNLNPLYPDGAMFWCVLITVYIVIGMLGNFKF